MEGSSTDPGQYAIAFYAGVYSYSGWSFLNYVVEEIKNPNKFVKKLFFLKQCFNFFNNYLILRVLPVSITMGLSGVIVIYTFVNIAYFTLLSPKEMIESGAVAFVCISNF